MDFRSFELTSGKALVLEADGPEFTVLAASSGFLKSVRLKREEIKGQHFFFLLQKISHILLPNTDQVMAAIQKVLETKNEICRELPSGLTVRINPLTDQAGKVDLLVLNFEDVRDNSSAMKDIQKSFHFFMNAPVIIGFVRGDDYIIELANEGLLEVWGRSQEQVSGKPLLEAIPELKSQGFRELLDEVRRTGVPFYATELPIELLRKGKKEVLYFDFVYKPFYNHPGDKIAESIFCVGTEVTQQIKSRQKFKNVVEQAVDPVLILKGEDMRLEVANQALLKLWKTDESAIGRRFLEIVPEMKDQGFLELLQNVLRTGESFHGYEVPAEFEEKDGTRKKLFFNFIYQPYVEADGEITGVLVFATDVTEKVILEEENRRNQQELLEIKERYELAIRATHDAIWDWNLQTNELIWNESVYSLFNYQRGQVSRDIDWWTLHVHPDDRQRSVNSIHAVINGSNNYWTQEYRFQCGDGSYKIVKDRGYVLRNKAGEGIRMIGSMQDITAAKQYEISLKENQQRWEKLANTMPVMVWTAKISGAVTFMNRYWYEFTGMTEEETLGNGWTKALHPDDVERCLAIWNNATSRNTFYELEARYRNKAGDYRWVLVRGVPIEDKDGKVDEWYGTSTDIHEQRMFATRLERQVEERTSELRTTNEKLQEFSYVASHDLKSPTRKIRIYLERLKEELGKDSRAGVDPLIARAEEAAARMSNLIDDLLDYSHAATGNHPHEELDLNQLLGAVLQELEMDIEEKKATVSADALPAILGHRSQLMQVFQNLINNSLKYSRKDAPPVISIRYEVVRGYDYRERKNINENQDYHLISIRDNGIGFDPQYSEKIFKPFSRLHDNSVFEGTGIGLAIVRQVIENHKGQIFAESEIGKGSVFKVLLPVA